jgi:MFS family permease
LDFLLLIFLVDNYVVVVFMISIAGFVQGYTEMMSILLIHDANFLEYITTYPEYFSKYFVFLLYFGSILGALISSSLSDRLGRCVKKSPTLLGDSIRRPTLLCFSAFLVGVISWMTSSDSQEAVLIARYDSTACMMFSHLS